MTLVLVWGCGSPNPDFYTLYPESGRTPGGAALQIEIRRPGLPGYLDRPNLVRRGEAGRLHISGTERWGMGLGELVGTTLARNLTDRLPQSTVYTESGVISSDPDVIIEIELQQFERVQDGPVRLVAQVAVHWAGGSEAAHIRWYELTREPDSDDTEATVAAMSALLAELSDAVARTIATGASTSGGHTQAERDEAA
jgi:hypothetical protein